MRNQSCGRLPHPRLFHALVLLLIAQTFAVYAPEVLRVAGLTPRHVVSLHTREDARLLLHRPAGTVPLSVNVWVARAGG